MPESRFEEALKTMASVMLCGKVEGEFYGCQLPELQLLFFPYGQDEAAVWERRTVQGELRSHWKNKKQRLKDYLESCGVTVCFVT